MATVADPLWPGAATFPNTNVYPGQGSVPFIRCLISTDPYQTAEPVYTDMSTRLRRWQVDRGRPNELQDFDAGNATIVLENRDRQLDPVINSAIRPMNRIRLYEEFSGEVRELFNGYAESYVQSWPDGGWSNALTTVRATDEMKVLALQALPTSGNIPAGVTGGMREQIGFILDQVGPNRAPRRLGISYAFPVAVTRAMTGQQPLGETAKSVLIEGPPGAFFCDAAGTLVFVGNAHRNEGPPFTPAQGTFDDDGTDLPYEDMTLDFSDRFIGNDWTVNLTAGSSGSASDATSIARYGRRAPPPVTLEASSGAASAAAVFLAKYKDPFTRVTSITPDMGDPETMRVAFSLDLMWCVRVFRTPPGGGARIDQTLYVQNISARGEPGKLPSLVLGVSPL